jgi:2'-5' RNA ligase
VTGPRGAPDRPGSEPHDTGAGSRRARTGGHATHPPTHRLFVAVWPSPEAVEHLRDTLAVDRPGGADLRWQPPERWHLTLAFLGDVRPERTERRLGRLVLPPAGPLQLAGAGTFGPVLWIGVAPAPWLGDLARDVRSALRVEDGPFRAHLTVARDRGRSAPAAARSAVPALAGYSGPTWTPEALTLVSSRTGPQPRYEVIASWPLPAPPAVGDTVPIGG